MIDPESLFVPKVAIPLFIGTCLLFFRLLSVPRQAQTGLPLCAVRIVGGEGTSKGNVVAEVASRSRQQQIGLMFRTVVPDGRGMYFPMRWRGLWPMTMRNTLAPLDILHFDGEALVSISEGVPLRRRPVGGLLRSTAVLEVRRGWCEAHGVVVGDRMVFGGGETAS